MHGKSTCITKCSPRVKESREMVDNSAIDEKTYIVMNKVGPRKVFQPFRDSIYIKIFGNVRIDDITIQKRILNISTTKTNSSTNKQLYSQTLFIQWQGELYFVQTRI